jgi:hypothetical protein
VDALEQLPRPACALDRDGLSRQRERYRLAGRGGRIVRRTPRQLAAVLAADVDPGLLDELVAVERACCPFFTIDWTPATRMLSFAVSDADHEPALDAIELAFS